LTGTVLENTQDPAFGTSMIPSYEDKIHPDTLANVPVEADMLPMLYARTTESVAMWDNTLARNLDSDGDGMTDLWETAMGLDPNDASGVNGAYGDYDRDGLANIYEYEAGTSPLEYASTTNNVPDFYAWGTITGELNHDYRTYGELLTDHDMMEDEWETLNGLSPFLFDAFLDADGDGWYNYTEFRYGSDPQDQQSIPFAELNFRFKYFGDATRFSSGTMLKIMAFTDAKEGADCVMAYEIGNEVEAVSGTTGILGHRPLAGSLTFTDSSGRTYVDDGNGLLIEDATGLPLGYINYTTGVWNLTAPAYMVQYQRADGSVFPMYGSAGYIFEITAGTRYTYLREGLNTFFVFADFDDNGFWDPTTEPAGTTENGPIMLKGGTPELIDISLKDFATGFPRLSWPVMQSAVEYRLNVAVGSVQLFSVSLPSEKYFFMENDYMEFYGKAVPEGTINWSLDVLTQSGAYSNNYASGTFDVNYPDYIKVPEIVTPNTSVKSVYYRVVFVWDNADKGVPFYELQIAKDAAFTDIIKSKTGFIPGDFAGHSQITLPELGDEIWEEGTYYWRVRSKTSGAVGAWSSVTAFGIDFDADPLYTCSIEGTAYYTGKAKTGTIIVEAYNNKSFSGTPLSIDYIENTPLPELWPMNPYTYKLDGLVAGTYYVRAFLDQNNNRVKDPFETYGYVTDGADVYTVTPIVLAYDDVHDKTNQDLFMIVADTDNDMLADDWEWSYLGALDIMGAGEVRGFTDYQGNGVNDFEAYAWSALNMSPIDGAVAGDDLIPYLMKTDFGIAITDPVELAFSNIYLDGKYGQVYVVWGGLGGSSSVSVNQNNGTTLSMTSGSSTVEYVLQSSRDLINWVDVDTAVGATYYSATDMFIYSGDVPEISSENNKPVFYRFKVRW
jgi:hypothetical protein